MPNPFDKFDAGESPKTPAAGGANPFDKFDAAAPAGPAEKPPSQGLTLGGAHRMMDYLPIVGPLKKAMDWGGEKMTKGAYDIGGKVTDIAGQIGAPPGVAAGAGFATNVGMQALPMLIGGGAAKGAAPAIESEARNLMQSALKPTLEQLRTGKAAKAIDTMLQEGINVSKGGIAKLRSKISDLYDEITQAIAGSPATVDKGKVARKLLGLFVRLEKHVTPQADVKTVEKAWKQFVSHPLLAGRQDMPVQLAQQMKQGTYKALGEKSYGELKGANVEAQKTLARGLKEGIAAAVPGIEGLNAYESKMLNALSVAERRVLQDANKNPMGLSILARNPEYFAVFMADRSTLFKSLVAKMLYRGSKQIPATGARLGIAGYEAAANQPGNIPIPPQGE